MKSFKFIQTSVFLSFIVMGFVDFVGVTIGYAGHELNLDKVSVQLIPFFTFIWFGILSLPAGHWMSIFSKKKVLILGVLLTFLGCLGNYFVYTFGSVLLGFLLIGVGNTLIQVSAGPLLKDVYNAEKFTSGMSFGFFYKSLMALLGPVLAYFFMRTTGNWRYTFLFYAIITLLVAYLLYLSKIDENKATVQPSFKTYLKLLKQPYFLILFLGIVSVVGIDVGIITSLSGYFEDVFALSNDKASLVLSLYFISMLVGRFLGAIVLRYVNTIKYLIYSASITILLFALMILSDNVYIAYIFIILFGIAAANFFALIYSLAIEKSPEYENQISGLMIMGIAGAAFAPLIMGILNEAYGVKVSFTIVLVLLLYVLFTGIYTKKYTKKNRH